MKPLSLTMTAFGPYRDAEKVDFGLLRDSRLFVITGSTGAGKTTIFDAICFALYGSASGEDRSETRMLRSHFADDETHTSVEFEFSVGVRSYRVFRQLAHRKGTNKSETGGKAELYETTSGEPVPCVDRFAVSDVNAKLERIVGLTREQFSQIVMLPQGEFRKLLTSDTENKEDILRRLFQTGLFRKLEERFHRKHREMTDAVKESRAKVEFHLQQAEESLPLREESALAAALGQEHRSALQVMEGLAAEAAYYREVSGIAEARKTRLAAEVESRQLRVHEAAVLNGRLDELDGKRRQLARLAERKSELEALERRLALAEQASRLQPYEEQADKAAAEARMCRVRHEEKRLAAEAAAKTLAQAEQAYRAEEAREPQRREAGRELERLGGLLPLVETLGERQAELERLGAQQRQLEAQLQARDEELGRLREVLRAGSEAAAKLEAEAAALPEKLELRSAMGEKYRLLKELTELKKRLDGFVELSGAREGAARLIRAEMDRMEALWIEGQAASLAAHLHEGEPCPVCGSVQHPGKAKSGGAVPSREELQQAKERLRHAERELEEAKAQAAASREGWESGIAVMDRYGIVPDGLERQLSLLEHEGKQLRAEIDRLKAQGEELSRLRAERKTLEERAERTGAEKERLLGLRQQHAVELAAKKSLLDKELEQIPDGLRSPAVVRSRLQEQQRLSQSLEAAWKEAGERLQRARTAEAEERASAAQLLARLGEAEESALQAAERFASELAAAGFGGNQSYKEAKLSERERQAGRESIEAYRTEAAALAQAVRELERELAGKQRIDVELLSAELAATKRELEETDAALRTAALLAGSAERLGAAIADARKRCAELESGLEEVADLYAMLKGDNPLKISFERYILIEFLEQILHAANERLRDLSNGQFVLERSGRLETRGKQSGLGLDVYDAYTGQNRDVKTLSGGEKFNASLALALGMTDVIQAHQGGISIEMMFIDEGFGSLDEESLNKAILTLIDLQRAGRMIGVISHVQELKQAFPAVLEVKKTKEGHSRTAIYLK
ncbi:AAA family ATPase [Paenibacillus beijingensis]|uniref:Nuclease SbcCD subunit C n=1 Tax=Paenibacillus beijingensis TaxID=1126833 RepID=A0A0D5NMU2_9BACL|nr:SMC family ATPase [Paenibacillus beijingensis]AJY76317.1 exonuclease [Paenibacillus beijingensis]